MSNPKETEFILLTNFSNVIKRNLSAFQNNTYLSLKIQQDILHTFRFRLAEGKEMVTKKKVMKGKKKKHMTDIEKAKFLPQIEEKVGQDEVFMRLQVSLSSVKRLVAKQNIFLKLIYHLENLDLDCQ